MVLGLTDLVKDNRLLLYGKILLYILISLRNPHIHSEILFKIC